jgi:uncharacterized membrane protein YraQ (UPF0718 family)
MSLVRIERSGTRSPDADQEQRRTTILLLGGLALFAVLLRVLGSGRIPWISNLLLIFSSLFLQAFPFVLLGAFVSAAIETLAPQTLFVRLIALPKAARLPAAGMAGLAFPLCECGSVPVARRLAARGLQSSSAVTFMLAASIFNPIVLLSTAIAYRGRSIFWIILVGRALLGLGIPIVAGWVIGDRRRESFLRPEREDEGHHGEPSERGRARLQDLFAHFAADALFMGRYLVLGAIGAAVIQTFLPQSLIASVSDTPGLDIVVMMGFAGILSLCSEADAFVAASFVQFNPAAQLAFLVFGPMFNLKLGVLYAGTFERGFVRTILVVVAASVFVGTLWIEAFYR